MEINKPEIVDAPVLRGNSSSLIGDLQESELAKSAKRTAVLNEEEDDIEPIPMKKNHHVEGIGCHDEFGGDTGDMRSPLEINHFVANQLNMSISVSCPELLE